MKLAVVSGKGGTGRTAVAVGLVRLAAEQGLQTALIDADLETPIADLLLRVVWQSETSVWQPVPLHQVDRCGNCDRCSDFSSPPKGKQLFNSGRDIYPINEDPAFLSPFPSSVYPGSIEP